MKRCCVICPRCRENKTLKSRGMCGACYQATRRSELGSVSCSVDECSNPRDYVQSGLCAMHGWRLRTNGTLNRVRRETPPCIICGGPHYGHELCSTCLRRFKRWGELFDAEFADTRPVPSTRRRVPSEPFRQAVMRATRARAFELRFIYDDLAGSFLLKRAGISTSSWKKEFWSEALVDRVCAVMGIHPLSVYPDYYADQDSGVAA